MIGCKASHEQIHKISATLTNIVGAVLVDEPGNKIYHHTISVKSFFPNEEISNKKSNIKTVVMR